MQTYYFTDLLARERIADFHRDADRDRLAGKVRAARRLLKLRTATTRARVPAEHRPERAIA